MKGDGYFLGLEGENRSETLTITVEDEALHTKWPYIEFKNNDEEKFSTERLTVVDGKIEYPVVNGLLKEGHVTIQVVFRDETGVVWKSYIRKFLVGESLCVSDKLPVEHPDFITEAQKLLDQIEINYEKINEVVDSEQDRVANEQARQANEEIRASAEVIRNTAEATRSTNETARVNAENERIINENLRQTNETTRQESEVVRQENERLRVEAENSRIEYLQSELIIRDKLVYNLEVANEGKTYENVADNSVAYQKANPENVLPFAKVNKVGGMSYKVDEAFQHTPITNVRSVGKNKFDISKVTNNTDYVINNHDGTLTVRDSSGSSCYPDGSQSTLKELAPTLVAGKTYVLSGNHTYSKGGKIFLNETKITWVFGSKLVITEEILNSRVFWYSDNSALTTDDVSTVSNIQIEEGEVATDYEPYKEYILELPTELEGYGLGVDETYHNYIDLKNRKYVQMVSELILDGTQYGGINATYTDETFVTATFTIADAKHYAMQINTITDNDNITPANEALKFAYQNTIYLKLLISRVGGNIIDDVRNYLTNNPIKVVYELATPIETDIEIKDYLLQVEEGGSITFENEYNQETPSAITYQVKLS